MKPPRNALRVALAAGLACLAVASHAAPDGPRDAVLQFLHERGLLPAQTDAPGVMLQARNAASELVLSAMAFLGVPYQRGGATLEDGFDCSGFTRHIFESTIGLVLPRRAEQQARSTALQTVLASELRPGDLVFFDTMRRAFSHVGIYVGDGKFIHAPRSGSQVRVEDMRAAYWTQRFNGARRVELPAAPVVPAGVPSVVPDAAVATLRP